MSTPRWERLQELFHQALALESDQRATLLARECAGDPELRAEVERLLSANDRAGGFIHEPAIASPGVALPPEEPSQAGRRIGAYRLLHALGRGGMGAVYLAERDDGAFAQRVAIKLIKRGMDTDQVLARFRAERQILASLDHPNIARLLDGGTTDDALPYFTMEYIDGQPIDKFAEERRLGVDQRLRLFLQVCDAVSYAHARGVVHRDIKPLNTLVTNSGLPKLLDFGIAKVLHDSPDEITTTITGLRLLTPDYASPEQIEGRRATAASDVYSLGVVLYELLTGRSPYRVTSRSPQEIAAAVCTTEPDRPSTVVTQPAERVKVRRTVPSTGSDASDAASARQLSRQLRGDLDTIVLMALRKEPERRYASVASLADDIRRHLDGRPIAARAGETTYRLGRFLRRHRMALLTASAAVVATVVLTTAGWLLARPGQGDPTLLSTRSLALRDRILVADFTDRSGDTTLAAAVTEAFRTDLAQSPVVRVMTPRQVRASLEMMRQSPDIALDDSLARQLALREGVKAFVTGSLVRLSGNFTIAVQLVAAHSGEALAAVRENAADTSQIILAVDRASKTLRRRIGESLRDLERAPSLEQATTASLPALRWYSEAHRLVRQGKRSEAVSRFERAVALDPEFAAAHLSLSMLYGAMSDEGRAYLARQKALEHQDRLTFLERSFFVGSRAYAAQDYVTAIRIYTEAVGLYPDNIPAINNLALAYQDSRQFAVAESLFRRAFEIDSTVANLLFGVHGSQALQGKFAEARATLDTIARRFPGHPVYLVEALQDAAAQQDWPRAEQVAWTTIREVGTGTLQQIDPYEALAGIAMTRGRLSEAERLWKTQLELTRRFGVMGRHLFGILQRGYLLLRHRGDSAGAVALVDSALRVTPLDSLLPGDRRYDEVMRFYVAAGQLARIGPLMKAAVATDSALHRTLPGDRLWTRGVVALAEGRIPQAIELLSQAAEKSYCTNCVLPDLGRAYEAGGNLREAAAAYQRYITTPWLWRYEPDAVELGWILRRLGELYEHQGDASRARMARQQLIDLWDRADPELHPLLDSVRTKLRQ